MSNFYINGVEVNEVNYLMYRFLIKDDFDLEMLFQMLLEETRSVISAISKFKNIIRKNRDIDSLINACSGKNVLECRELLEKLFLEPIDVDFVAERMKRQGWSLEELLKEHKRNSEKKIHRILNIPFKTYISK